MDKMKNKLEKKRENKSWKLKAVLAMEFKSSCRQMFLTYQFNR